MSHEMFLQTPFDHEGNEIICFFAYVPLQTFTEVSVVEVFMWICFPIPGISPPSQTTNECTGEMDIYGIINWNHVWPWNCRDLTYICIYVHRPAEIWRNNPEKAKGSGFKYQAWGNRYIYSSRSSIKVSIEYVAFAFLHIYIYIYIYARPPPKTYVLTLRWGR